VDGETLLINEKTVGMSVSPNRIFLRVPAQLWNYGHFLVLAAVVVGAAALSLWWVFLVPIYQSPDEPVHLDYALCLNERRGLFHGVVAPPGKFPDWIQHPPLAHPYARYLEDAACTRQVTFRPDVRMPLGYGSQRFYREVERRAPPVETIQSERSPVLAAVYPFGYYALLAAWLDAVRFVHDGPVGLLFGARLFSVLLFVVSLVLTYATCRELNLRRLLTLVLTAIVGFFPMTTFVSSYVQPDNLGFTLVSLCFLLSLRWQRRPSNRWLLAALGLDLGLLWVTKKHFALCMFLSVIPVVAARLWVDRAGFRAWLRHGIILLLPVVLLGPVQLWVETGARGYWDELPPYQGFNTTVLTGFTHAIMDYYNGGTHRSFWGVFGWLDTPLVIRDEKTTTRVNFVIDACTWVVLALTLLRLEQVGTRLWRLWRCGKGQEAARIALSNVPINSYFLYTVLMFGMYVRLESRLSPQGRNWLPFLLPIFLTAILYAPKALTGLAVRRGFAAALALALLIFDGVGGYYAIKTIEHRYYGGADATRAVPYSYRSASIGSRRDAFKAG
jgi:hypothetical protein